MIGWVEVVWPVVAGTCLALALICLLIWTLQPSRLGYLLFFVSAASVTVFAGFELFMMKTASPEHYAAALRWAVLPIVALVFSLLGFVLFYLRSGRWWLAAAACVVRVAGLFPNFTTGVNLYFQHVSAMLPLSIWGGDTVYAPIGTVNPWVYTERFGNLLLIVFMADASLTLWRRRDPDSRRRALGLGTSMVVFLGVASIFGILVNSNIIHSPYFFSPMFLVVLVAMAYELGWDVFTAARLSDRLQVSEENLRESERRLQLAATAAELGLWEWDVPRDRIWMTGGTRAMFGYAPDEEVGLARFLAALHREDRDAVQREVRGRMLHGGSEFEQDFRVALPNQQIRWVRVRGRIERDAAGRAVRIRGVSHDVSARRHADERFRALVEAAPTAMLVVDSSGRIARANGRAALMFGYERGALPGMSIDALIPPGLQPAQEALLDAPASDAKRDAETAREFIALRKDGTAIAVEANFSALPGEEGPLTLASVLDISQRKASELEASRQRDQLARVARVAMLGELSGALAHELNQPLSAILGNAQAAQRFLMREPPQVDTVREILADIVGSGRRAAEVIARVRSLIRNDEPPQHALDPDQLVAEVLALMRNDLAAREVVVRTELAADLPRLRGDRVQLQQLLLNLLFNACDAMADAPAPHVILIDTVQSGPGRILIRIKDAGPGILDGELERIFEPFVTTKRDGLGLGLALCRTIVRAHDGRIWAGNHPDGGAILHVELPAPRA